MSEFQNATKSQLNAQTDEVANPIEHNDDLQSPNVSSSSDNSTFEIDENLDVDTQIEILNRKLKEKEQEIDEKLKIEIQKIDEKLEIEIQKIDKKMEKLNEKLNAKLKKIKLQTKTEIQRIILRAKKKNNSQHPINILKKVIFVAKKPLIKLKS